jgi:transcriptional regulator with XRE-family HTH domain
MVAQLAGPIALGDWAVNDEVMAEVVFDDPVDEAEEKLFEGLLRSPAPARTVLRRGVNYSHDAMIDAIIQEPGITQNDLAKMFGYSVSWISQIVNSDAFQAKLASRASEIRDPLIVASMEEQFKGILARGLELTRTKLEAENVSENFLLRSMDLSTRALGYGVKKDESGRGGNVEEKLADLSNNLVNLLRAGKRNALTVDMEPG